jgi:hypothetical protein
MSWSGMWIGGRCGHPIRFLCCQSEASRDAPLTISQCCGNRLPVRWLACEASRHAQFTFQLPYDRPSAPFSVSIPNYHVIIWGLSSASRSYPDYRYHGGRNHTAYTANKITTESQPSTNRLLARARGGKEKTDCHDRRRPPTVKTNDDTQHCMHTYGDLRVVSLFGGVSAAATTVESSLDPDIPRHELAATAAAAAAAETTCL